MDGSTSPRMDMAAKIARLVEERGWNQEDFARIAQLNRHTVREIIKNGKGRRLRNATVKQCAEALGLDVSELREQPLERLLPRMHGQRQPPDEAALKLLQEKASQPELAAWVEKHPERAAQLTAEEAEELISIQGPHGPLVRIGVEKYVELIERRRMLLQQVIAIAGTEYLCMLEQFVNLLHEKVQTLSGRQGDHR
ncbi:MAG: helix-turn-helix transcriptional regulator [Planctomycetes bacterium]|nr:helix-turn-helix transcriptional regulator [Planctomycetota bacterium]